MATADIHTTGSFDRISKNAADSTFAEVDDLDRVIPAIEFRNVRLSFDERTVLNGLSF